MPKRFMKCVMAVAIAAAGSTPLFPQRSEPNRPAGAHHSEQRVFGPYRAITFDTNVLNDVKVDANGNIFLQLNPDHKDKELVVKISNEKFGSYRPWWHGELELVSPSNAGKLPMGWTDRVQTQARFVEYWMDGKVFLHLQRMDT